MAVISEASHRLAQQISVRSVVEFAVIFGLIWIAWVNGSLYVELHGCEDGRTRDVTRFCALVDSTFKIEPKDRELVEQTIGEFRVALRAHGGKGTSVGSTSA